MESAEYRGGLRIRGFHEHFRPRPFRTAWWAALAVAVSIPGCRRSGHQPLAVYPAKGELFVAGEPAENAVIAFHPINRTEWPSTTSRAVVEQTGRFSLTTYAANDGAPEGEYAVTVYWPARPLNPDGEGGSLPDDKLGRRFANAARSNLRARLGKQPVTFAHVDLKDKAVLEEKEFYFVVEQAP